MRVFGVSKFLPVVILVLALLLNAVSYSKTNAAESGISFYVPGLYGDIAVAIPLSPGFYALSTSIHYQTQTPNSILPNGIDEKIEADVFSQLLRGFWVPDETVLGAKMMMGIRVIAHDIDVTADINTPAGLVQIDDSNSGFGDLVLLPMSLYWQFGNLSLNLYEAINIPIGQYDKTRFANISLNHWAFDTVLAITWLDQSTGIEISVTPGLIYNTVNKNTNYQTGIEFHMDAMLNLHLSQNFVIGLHGSIYRQLTGDKGADPSLGSFKGQAYALGPSITWYEKSTDPNFLVSLKWLHEFNVKNKSEGDLTILTVGLKF